MEYRMLGKTGLRVGALGFGCGSIGGLAIRGEAKELRRAVTRAIEAGINYFDTAAAYGDGKSEETVGPLLREVRAQTYLGTKVGLKPEEVAQAPQAIRRSLEASLRRLGWERVDLFQLHNHVVADGSDRPGGVPLSTVLGPIAEGFAAVRQAGLTRFIGLTGLGETEALHRVVDSGAFDTVQSYVNAINPSAGWPVKPPSEQGFDGLIGRAAAGRMGVIAIRVLAAGALAGGAERHPIAGDPGAPLVPGAAYSANVEKARGFAALAVELGLDGPAELSLRLVLGHPGVSVALVGYSDVGQLEDALRWTGRGPLPAPAVDRILALAAK
jgi:aryl-alcohol dehydrogenase-like predicted oxidoreductase